MFWDIQLSVSFSSETKALQSLLEKHSKVLSVIAKAFTEVGMFEEALKLAKRHI
ncbi:MAG: hypothetical protein QFX40_03320 [Archaeoglobales archaeon]|nr:hypothetical protein [Archaeoglobales archaeon]